MIRPSSEATRSLVPDLLDLVTVAVLAGAIIALALLYAHERRILWSDELFGWMLVTDPSWRHMFAAWSMGADGGGICFYVLARCWLKLFGETATAFRMFSAAGVAIGVAFTFLAARCYVKWSVALSCVAVLWFSSDIVLWQLMQARFYGMLLAGAAAACYLAVLTSDQLTRRLLLLTSGCHTLLVGAHPFGMLYSGMIVLAMVSADIAERRFRLQLYLSALSGWWVLLVSVTAMQNTAAVGRPRFWPTRPTLIDLGNTYACWSMAGAVALGVAGAIWGTNVLMCGDRLGMIKQQIKGRRMFLSLAGGLLAVPLLTFVVSQRGNSLFVDRYLAPVVIAMSFVLCLLGSGTVGAVGQRFRVMTRQPIPFLAGLALGGILAWGAVVQFPSYWTYPAPDHFSNLLRLLPKGIPIVVEPVDLFDQLLAYHRQEGYQFVCVLDWENAINPLSPQGEVSGFHQMENWRRVGYFSGSILYSKHFLANTPEFVVVDDPQLLWFERKVFHNPLFQVEPISGELQDGASGSSFRLWRVRRLPESASH